MFPDSTLVDEEGEGQVIEEVTEVMQVIAHIEAAVAGELHLGTPFSISWYFVAGEEVADSKASYLILQMHSIASHVEDEYLLLEVESLFFLLSHILCFPAVQYQKSLGMHYRNSKFRSFC